MAATAAASGVLGRLGWRLLQLRCLPGEVTAEPGRGGKAGRRRRADPGLAWDDRGCGGSRKVKGIGMEPLESRAGNSHLGVSLSGLEL